MDWEEDRNNSVAEEEEVEPTESSAEEYKVISER
jgi:hypothetical protein